MLKTALGLVMLVCAGASADTLRLSFQGVVTGGTYFTNLNDGSSASGSFPLIPIQGYLDVDLNQIPTPSVTNPGALLTQSSRNAPPMWLSHQMDFSGFQVPAGALSLPTVFHLNREQAPPGAVNLQSPATTQNLAYGRGGVPSFAMIASDFFLDYWTTSSQTRFLSSRLDLTIKGDITVPGRDFAPFDIGNAIGSSGRFSVGEQDQQLPNAGAPLFGNKSFYNVSFDFQINSAQAQVLTPEPGTWFMTGIALAVLALAANRSGLRRASHFPRLRR